MSPQSGYRTGRGSGRVLAMGEPTRYSDGFRTIQSRLAFSRIIV